MKQTLLIITSLLFITSTAFPQSKVNINSLKEYGGKAFKVDDDKPYTGIVFDFYENGQKKLNGRYKNGLMNGKWTYYHRNGQKEFEVTYKDGIEDGLWTYWYENGQKGGTYKDGKKNGNWMHWDLNGSKILDENFENGILNGPMISWYPNGQKEMVILWENGKKQDLTYWSEDGQSININALNPFPIMEFLDGKRDLETLPRSE